MGALERVDSDLGELRVKMAKLEKRRKSLEKRRRQLRGRRRSTSHRVPAASPVPPLTSVVDQHLQRFRSVFSRQVPFELFVIVAWAFLLRLEGSGVSSAVRCLGLDPSEYLCLLGFFHSSAFHVATLCRQWASILSHAAPGPKIGGRPVLVADAIKVAKAGRKMPGVKVLHQESESNTKREYINGHFWGCVSILIGTTVHPYAAPIRLAIQDGIKLSPSDRTTLPMKMASLVCTCTTTPSTVVVDSYYAAAAFLRYLLKEGHHAITRLRSNAVAYEPAAPVSGKRPRGRPCKYGKKMKLASLFSRRASFQLTSIPLYGDIKDVLFLSQDLYWGGLLVRIVLTIYPDGATVILLSTDLNLIAEEIITGYGYRFKIEVQFKQLVHTLWGFRYHFWMLLMPKAGSRPRNLYTHRKTPEFRAQLIRKMEAYERFVNIAAIALGLLQLLAVNNPDQVWAGFPVWFRSTPRHGCPSETVARLALQADLQRAISGGSRGGSLLAETLAKRKLAEPTGHPLQVATARTQ